MTFFQSYLENNMSSDTTLEIYFLACEEKDLMSLLPVWQAVREKRSDARLLTLGFRSDYANGALELLSSASFPIIISSSPGSVLQYLQHLRPRWSYYFVGIEHGLSPFKKFTYSSSFLIYDEYFAPTLLWKERLERLYPNTRTRFHLGDYPKAAQEFSIENKNNNSQKHRSVSSTVIQSVVIFSWGLLEKELRSLPDLNGITYLLHPAQERFPQSFLFSQARVVWSSKEETSNIIKKSDRIFGDISSLTFETARIRPTWLVIDRGFYVEDYDIDEEIMDPLHENFARVPETNYRIDRRFILNKQDLIEALLNGSTPTQFPLHTEPTLMPTLSIGDKNLCAKGILDICDARERLIIKEGKIMPHASAVEFIRVAYLQLLDREPDAEGLNNYLQIIYNSDQNILVSGLKVLLEMASSEEALNRKNLALNMWPLISLTTNPSR